MTNSVKTILGSCEDCGKQRLVSQWPDLIASQRWLCCVCATDRSIALKKTEEKKL